MASKLKAQTKTQIALNRVSKSQDIAHGVMVLEFPIDSMVRWLHNEFWQRGWVVDHHQWLTNMKVHNERTHKEVWIDAGRARGGG